MTISLLIGVSMCLAVIATASAQYQGWQHAGSFRVLTTKDGANLPATAMEEGFPLRLRLDKGSFDFKQAQATGGDLRFAAAGKPLAYQIGGWGNYVFNGDLDEVRVSKVARSADWVKLRYENQKPSQTVGGPLVRPGCDFAASVKAVFLTEGKRLTVQAKAGGARKLYWIIKRGTLETVASVDRFSFTLDAGRVTGDAALTHQLKAVFANDAKTLEIPVTIKEDMPDHVKIANKERPIHGNLKQRVVAAISALMALSKTVLDLPANVLTAGQRAYCEGFRKTLPPLPTRERRGHQTLAPAESWKAASIWDNIELPGLYPVFPFHIYGVGRPHLQLARDTREFSFGQTRQKRNFCWYQSLIHTADLGLTEQARGLAMAKLLWPNREKGAQSGMRYPVFYDTFGCCQRPDFDHGGCAMVGLQDMLMQIVDEKILLFPAWPEDWHCDFKLHAPNRTTVAGVRKAGKLEKLTVMPETRTKDVVNMLEKKPGERRRPACRAPLRHCNRTRPA